ncbi:MAG: hypothetical protein L0221_19855 [Chloroflexi bacterium]|nr:hypothetical protein [Chloroflexota bacterium]
MPKLVCRSCGQGVYTTAPFEQLFADERRCPRCGQLLFSDRRSGAMRRRAQRRQPAEIDAAATPATLTNGAPLKGTGNGAAAHDVERRVGDRRQIRRRREDNNPFQRASEEAGWAG